MDYAAAILHCRPNSNWTVGDTYGSLQWFDESQSKPTEAELETAWIQYLAMRPKTWPNVQAFMAEFTMPEKAQIALSVDPTIAALRLEMSTWFSQVLNNDERVTTGLQRMVDLGIISPSRITEITAL